MSDRLVIRKVETWETSDGVIHATHAMAEHYVLNREMVDELMSWIDVDASKAQDILNVFTSRRPQVRIWLDACDKMEKASHA